MSDLSNRFNNSFRAIYSPTRSSLPSDSSTIRSSPITHTQDWNLRELEAKMKKAVRKEVSAASLKDELKVFYDMQKGVTVNKIVLLLGFTFLPLKLIQIEGAVFFTFFLLIASELFCSSSFQFESNLVSNIRRLQPIIYCSIFYSLLKWLTETSIQEIDWNLTFLAIVATFLHCILAFYKPFAQLATSTIITKAILARNLFSKLAIFPYYLIQRVKNFFNMTHHLILVGGCLSSGLIAAFIIFNKFSMGIFQPHLIIISLPLFIVLQIYFSLIDFINLAFSVNVSLCWVIKDKIPIFLNLLRLESNPFNRLVQLECLKCIFLKVSQDKSFLSTETCKSLLYNTYMDIFNQFTVIQLEKSEKLMQEIIGRIKRNDKTINIQKGLLEDLLIYLKKVCALVMSQWQASKFVGLLSSLAFLFLILKKIQKEADEKDARISQRVLLLNNAIYQNIIECSRSVSLSKYTLKQMKRFSHKFLPNDQEVTEL